MESSRGFVIIMKTLYLHLLPVKIAIPEENASYLMLLLILSISHVRNIIYTSTE